MGERFTFNCQACGSSAEVSGGGDSGYSFCTQTILCFDCIELMDIAAAVVPGEEVVLLHVCFQLLEDQRCPICGRER